MHKDFKAVYIRMAEYEKKNFKKIKKLNASNILNKPEFPDKMIK